MAASIRTSHGAFVLVVMAAASWWACSSKTTANSTNQTVKVGYGDTCGDIRNYPGATQTECDAGDCVVLLNSYPDGGPGVTLGVCSQAYVQCPSPDTCPSGFNCQNVDEPIRSVGACLKDCTTTDDCEGPFQLCRFGRCQPLPCSSDVDCTSASSTTGEPPHCSDRICVRGNASTR